MTYRVQPLAEPRIASLTEAFQLYLLTSMRAEGRVAETLATFDLTRHDAEGIAKHLAQCYGLDGPHHATIYDALCGPPLSSRVRTLASPHFNGSIERDYQLPCWPTFVFSVCEQPGAALAWGMRFRNVSREKFACVRGDTVEAWSACEDDVLALADHAKVLDKWDHVADYRLSFKSHTGSMWLSDVAFDWGLLQSWKSVPDKGPDADAPDRG